MPLILTQKLKQMTYRDVVGELYHYPKEYWSYINTGETFIYYHPFEKEDRKQYYFGVGKIGVIYPDPEDINARFAEIIDYSPFEKDVFFKDENGIYLEKRVDKGEQFFRAVRLIDSSIFGRILSYAKLKIPFPVNTYRPNIDTDELLRDFNSEYENLTPKKYQRMASIIDRPTSVSNALKKRANYTCQICGEVGFEKKSGEKYIEAHHIIELNQMVPNSLVSDNILIVCPTCHRKLHYASVTTTVANENLLIVDINGVSYTVKRNRI